jgi:beta-phosphoglucomutase-like phosphatase (HAD superfamily)
MDGVLIGSSEMIYRAIEHVLTERGVSGVTRQHMAEVTGKPIAEMYRILAPGLDLLELEKLHLDHHAENPHL